MASDQAASSGAVAHSPGADEPDALRDEYEAAVAAVRDLYEYHALALSIQAREEIRRAFKSLRRLAQLVPGLPLPVPPRAYGDLYAVLSGADRVRQAREAQEARVTRYGRAPVNRVSPGQETP